MTAETIEPYGLPRVQTAVAGPPPFSIVRDDDAVGTHDVQLASEGVVEFDDTNSIEFMGKRFGLAESIGLMPLLKFAHAAKAGLTSDDMEGLEAMYLLIRSCLDRSQVQAVDSVSGERVFDEAGSPVWDGPSQWDLFEQHAIETNADGEDLSEFINKAVQVVSARPRKPRGASSASSRPTSPSSRGSSSSPGTRPVPPGFEGLTPVGSLGQQDR
jgi:hypothetical protein